MSTPGFSKSRLERMQQTLLGYVERKEIPGLVALVSHHDDAQVETLGTMAFGHPAPIKRDTILRIASITKPITAVAAMILVEECKLRLDESIETWLPELANRRVLKSISSPLDDTVPALRAITLRDLITYRMGFGSVMAMSDRYLFDGVTDSAWRTQPPFDWGHNLIGLHRRNSVSDAKKKPI
jgi:CubicO group peptidase (beta-lactamase class C family)